MAGEGSTSSSLTSTSHTLTHPAPTSNAMAATTTAPLEAASMLAFLDSLKAENRHAFLQPSASISTASLHWAKQALDAFAGQVSDEQQAAWLRDRKRKRDVSSNGDILKIRKVHVDGFETGQVWQQTRRIINSALSLSENVLQDLKENGQIQADETVPREPNGDASASTSDENASEPALSEESSASGSDDDGAGKWEDAESQQGRSDASEGDEDDGEDIEDIEDEGSQAGEDDFDDQPDNIYVEDPHGLNDGFFSIDDFNRQSQYFEDQDAKADPFTDQADDDDEIDWHGDPFAAPKGNASKSTKGEEAPEGEDEAGEEGEEDDDDGPTFGDMDLYAPEGASDDEGDLEDGIEGDMGLDLTANDIFYKDFFAPPPRKAKAGEKPRKAKPARQGEPDDRDVERAMDNVRRDLFDDVSDNSDEEDALSDVSAGDPKSRRSAHERRQAKLSEEIRKMEAELVAKRAWTLSGEASASARPMNSLLEEDLDFEHAGKPIPVITEEVSEEIEDLIKRRIIAGVFDGVPKRRPDADVPADVRRGLVELDDAKAKQSLAEIYEEDHVKATDPDSYISAKNEKLHREEKEIEAMWKDISAKLDALSSWHYKPKPAAPSLQVVADVATVAMEDAQPTTAQGVSGGESMIAPQEVYNPSKDTAEKGEVVAKSGLPVARQEMSREDKLRRRRREKERTKKAGGGTSKISKKAQEKKDTMAELRKGGVKVINKKGEIMDMEGKKPQAARAVTSESFKL
jgi:U3 small nucleolar RNA-associated protein MPP10